MADKSELLALAKKLEHAACVLEYEEECGSDKLSAECVVILKAARAFEAAIEQSVETDEGDGQVPMI